MSSHYDIWGKYPPLSPEGIARRHNQLLTGLRSDIRSLPQPTSPDVSVEVYHETFIEIDTEGIIRAIEEMECGVVEEIQQLGALLGNKLDNIGWTMVRLVDIAEGVAGYMRSLEQVIREPLANTARQHAEQGLVWFYEGELELAKPSLLKALEFDTTNFLARYHLGFIHLIAEDYSSAWRAFELAAKCTRDSVLRRAETFMCAARAARLDDDSKQFRYFLKQATSICKGKDPREAIIWFEYALIQLGDKRGIKAAFLKVLKCDDSYLPVIESLRCCPTKKSLLSIGWMSCPRCHKAVPAHSTKCKCGKILSKGWWVSCPKCGKATARDMKKCCHCGATIPQKISLQNILGETDS